MKVGEFFLSGKSGCAINEVVSILVRDENIDLPAVSVSLDDRDGGFRSGHVVLDADEMRMRNVRAGIMYSGDRGMWQLDVQGLWVRSWNGGRLRDVEHMMNRLRNKQIMISVYASQRKLYERNYKNAKTK